MGNKWDEMRESYREAERQIQAADAIVNDMAGMLQGRLRKVSTYKLSQLKRELREFNIHTGKWNK
ncbi:MAG: hypothetical protein ABFD06_00130 [Smithella sp.]